MKHSVRLLSLLALALALAAACTDHNPLGPGASAARPAPEAGLAAGGTQRITVLTRNMYVGADVDAVIAALASPDPNDDLPALLAAIQTLQETSYPARAAAFADEIARTRPHAVGLQEVSNLDIDLTALGLPFATHLDFLATLQAELAARGLDYVVAARVSDTDASPFPGIHLLDNDVLLVDRSRVAIGAPIIARNYSLNIGEVAPGLNLKRGFVAVPATIGGIAVTLVNTHLESGDPDEIAQLRAAQAAELVQTLDPTRPAILLGDFNDNPGSAMWHVITGAGFADAWPSLRPGAAGFTCCNLPDLSNPIARFDHRIDFVFARGLSQPNAGLQGKIELVGLRPWEKVPGPAFPIWPSDHGGVVADLLLAPARGLAR